MINFHSSHFIAHHQLFFAEKALNNKFITFMTLNKITVSKQKKNTFFYHLYNPILCLQFGQACCCPWQLLTQYGIKQHPSIPPRQQITIANAWVLAIATSDTSVMIWDWQTGHVIGRGPGPSWGAAIIVTAENWGFIFFGIQDW